MSVDIKKINEEDYEKIFVMTDLHGRYDLFTKIIDEINFTKKDLLIIMGDSCDRGEYTYELYNWYITRQNEGYSIVHLSGNHEEMLKESKTDRRYRLNWMYNGGIKTVESFFRNQDKIEDIEEYWKQEEFYRTVWLFEFIEKMPDIVEGKNHLFVHAGIDFSKELSDQKKEYIIWTRDNWQRNNRTGKRVYHGHTPQLEGISAINNCINLDRGAFHTGILNCVEIKENKIYTVKENEVKEEKFEIVNKDRGNGIRHLSLSWLKTFLEKLKLRNRN